jgi:hypothetical protein
MESVNGCKFSVKLDQVRELLVYGGFALCPDGNTCESSNEVLEEVGGKFLN